MPVKLGSPLDNGEAKIEVIPLIDIMFFLLAAFMLASLSMVSLNRVQVNLPTATVATDELKHDLFSLSVDKNGVVYFEKTPLGNTELAEKLQAARQANPALRVLISGDTDARHGDILRALNIARAAGIENVSFETRPQKQ